MTQPTIELLPCPFCGGKAVFDGNGFGDYYARCVACGARSSDWHCEERGQAAERWNTRAKLAEKQGVAEIIGDIYEVNFENEGFNVVSFSVPVETKWHSGKYAIAALSAQREG